MSRRDEYAQHFLASPRIVAELVGHSNIRKNDTVYDLGAGSGVISCVLSERCKEVLAVEIEPGALKKLRINAADFDNVTILNQDMLQLETPASGYKIFSNIPFNLSASVVRKFAFSDHPPKSMYLIVQKQFARKLVQSDQHFNSLLGAELWPWYSVRIRKPLRKTDFTPPPAVDTVLIEIKPLEVPLIDVTKRLAYHDFVTKCFSLQKYFQSLNREKAGVSAERKPSELSAEQWVRLFESR